MVYQWREGARFPVEAAVAGRELERIASIDTRDRVLPAVVVDESRPEVAPLHRCFEWDDFRAAELHRQEQARQVIRSVYVVHEAGDEAPKDPVLVYVHVHDGEGEPCYVRTSVAMVDDAMRAEVIADAMALLRGVQRRFAHLSELQGVFAEIDRTERQFARQEQERADAEAAAEKAKAKKEARRRKPQPVG